EHPTGLVFRNSRGGAWLRNLVSRRLKKLRPKFGLDDGVVFYSLRHLFITDALERGVPIATVAELVGHRDLTMISRIYSRLSGRTAHLRDAVNQVRPVEVATPIDEPSPTAPSTPTLAERYAATDLPSGYDS